MKIYVPSKDRAHRLEVFRQLPPDRATLVVSADQADAYSKAQPSAEILVQPDDVKGIAAVRNWLLRLGGKMLMIDDDLRFFSREKLGMMELNRTLRISTRSDIEAMLDALSAALDTHAHASISPRQFNNALADEPRHYGRYFRFCGFNTALMPHIVQSNVDIVEDLEIAVQLYKLGLPAVLFSVWAHDDIKGTNSSGGCSSYRTHEMQAAAVRKMAEIHAPFVTVVEKKAKSGGDFGTRLDPKINWKKLYEFGRSQ